MLVSVEVVVVVVVVSSSSSNIAVVVAVVVVVVVVVVVAVGNIINRMIRKGKGKFKDQHFDSAYNFSYHEVDKVTQRVSNDSVGGGRGGVVVVVLI